MLLLALGWWGVRASDQGDEEMGRWAEAFDDIQWGLEYMLNDSEEEEEIAKNKGGSTIPAKRTTTGDDDHPVSKR